MDVSKIDGEQYCMNCDYWKRVGGRIKCTNDKAKCVWFANQLNGCDFFKGKLMPKRIKGGVVLRETTYQIKEGKIF